MRCPVCSTGGSFSAVERHGRFTVLHCPACDVQFSEPMEAAGDAFYDSHELYAGPEIWYTSTKTLQWDQRMFLRDRPHPGGRLLDVGCGTGYFIAAARADGYHVSGIDLSHGQLEVARRRFGLTDVHALTLDEYAGRVAPMSFDLVTAFQVLEHVADPAAFLRKIRTLVAPEGFVAIGVPNWRVWSLLREPLDRPPNHLTRWSARSLHDALTRADFEVVRIREHRSAYGVMMRGLRLGVLRRAMQARSGMQEKPAVPVAPGETGAAGTTATRTSAAVLTLAVAKARLLTMVDVPVGMALGAIRAPGCLVYALARARR